MDHCQSIYKVGQLVEETLLSSLMLFNTRVVFHSHTLNLSLNKECQFALSKYRTFKQMNYQKMFKDTIKKTKWVFFNEKIQEIVFKNQKFCDFMNQVKKQKLPTIKALHFNGQPCIKLDELWQTLHQSFNLAQNHQININVLNELSSKPIQK